MSTLLVTGTNRGLGLGLVKSFAADGWRVHACCRQPDRAAELKDLPGDIIVHRLDVTDHLRIASLARELSEEPLDILINNAAIAGPARGDEIDYEAWLKVFAVNSLAPFNMADKFRNQVGRSERKLIVNISSHMGSITDNTSGGRYFYRSSKAALNMITRSLAHELSEDEITVVALHPGWVKTDMGTDAAPLTVGESVESMRFVIDRLGIADSGKFFAYDGSQLPW